MMCGEATNHCGGKQLSPHLISKNGRPQSNDHTRREVKVTGAEETR
jgi:hypothetical protein